MAIHMHMDISIIKVQDKNRKTRNFRVWKKGGGSAMNNCIKSTTTGIISPAFYKNWLGLLALSNSKVKGTETQEPSKLVFD